MAGELLEATGVLLSLIGVVLGVVVSAGILVQIGAPLWLWLVYILELVFIVIGVILRAVGEHL